MIYVTNPKESLKLFEALSSPVRLQVIDLLHDGKEMNINELAKQLNLTNSAMTMHIQKLSECGVIRVRLSSSGRGTQKLCSLTEDKLLIELADKSSDDAFYETELEVGQYTEYAVNPTCGLATTYKLIGDLDNPQAFAYPERFSAHALWFTDGYVTYHFPNELLTYQKPKDLQFSFEISGEAPGVLEYYPSDIRLIVNGVELGVYECAGEYFERKGRYTPDWWFKNFGQYGRIKILSVTDEGTYLDGLPLSDVTLRDMGLNQHKDISLSFDCRRRQGGAIGGINLFGTGFGDYNQGIRCRLYYTTERDKS